MFSMVNHEPGHATVDTDVFAGDETGLVGTEEQRHCRDVLGLSHPAYGLLGGVRAGDIAVGSVDPTGRNTVQPGFARKAHGHGVGQGSDPALCGGIALCLRLAHAIPGGGNVDHHRAGGEVRHQQLGEIERRGDAHRQGVGKLFLGTVVDAFHQRQGVIDQIIHLSAFPDHIRSEPF